jgi:hypothetical protein
MRKQIELKCPICDTSYSKDESEYNRNNKLGRVSCCSRTCTAIYRNKRVSANSDNYPDVYKNRYDISQHAGNQKDELTPFKYMLKCISASKSRKASFITIQDLKTQWELQKGLCAITGLPMILPTHNKLNKVNYFEAASVDRVDSSKPYTKQNIQFLLRPINLLKNKFTDAEVVVFLKKLKNMPPTLMG